MNTSPASSAVKGISLVTATAVVIANMVGTGIFTSLGFQVGDLPSGFVIVMLWAVGGLCAFCGALAYGELAAAMPRSGGEYHYLSKIFHPSVGFVAGWLSATVGFAAPIALAAMAFGKYFEGIVHGGVSAVAISLGMVWFVTLIHMSGIDVAAKFQNTATWMKVALILIFIGSGIAVFDPQPIQFMPQPGDWKLITSAPFAVSLVYVMYAYAGWNASTYIVGEVDRPKRNVPLSVAIGTLIVTGLYIGLNMIFLRVAPMSELAGKLEVGHVAADHVFGKFGGNIMSGLICLGLVSCISAMTWVGPRVTMAMGQDVGIMRPLATVDSRGVPVGALFLQLAIVITLLLTASFNQVLTYVQFSIQLGSFMTVLGMMILRYTKPNLERPVRCWGYPLTPLIFLGISLWMMVFMMRDRPQESLAGLGTVALGLLIYAISPKTPAVTDETTEDVKEDEVPKTERMAVAPASTAPTPAAAELKTAPASAPVIPPETAVTAAAVAATAPMVTAAVPPPAPPPTVEVPTVKSAPMVASPPPPPEAAPPAPASVEDAPIVQEPLPPPAPAVASDTPPVIAVPATPPPPPSVSVAAPEPSVAEVPLKVAPPVIVDAEIVSDPAVSKPSESASSTES